MLLSHVVRRVRVAKINALVCRFLFIAPFVIQLFFLSVVRLLPSVDWLVGKRNSFFSIATDKSFVCRFPV